jgi:hypothetical protein
MVSALLAALLGGAAAPAASCSISIPAVADVPSFAGYDQSSAHLGASRERGSAPPRPVSAPREA